MGVACIFLAVVVVAKSGDGDVVVVSGLRSVEGNGGGGGGFVVVELVVEGGGSGVETVVVVDTGLFKMACQTSSKPSSKLKSFGLLSACTLKKVS